MREQTFVIGSAWQALSQVIPFVKRLTFEKPWRITFQLVEPGSTLDQQATLRGIEQKICDHTGEDMPRVHDELLCRHYGTEQIDLGNGNIHVRPARRTRTGPNPLSESEMQEHIEYVRAFAASECGIELR